MEIYCTLKTIVGGTCGHDHRDRQKLSTVVPIYACQKEISHHERTFQFFGHKDEVDLILSRAGVFTSPKDIETWTICPLHRAKLGLGWTTRIAGRCRVPVEISNHGKSKKRPKAERGLSKTEAQLVLKKTGILVQVGSGLSNIILCQVCIVLI